jgi:hypothetical protein
MPEPKSLLALLGLMQPARSHATEPEFQDWYKGMSQEHDLAPNPDSPDQFYDYRAAHAAGAKPDETGHWPSTYKREGHPNMVVGGFHVQTGQRVPGAPLAKSVQELVELGWDPQTAARLWSQR